MTRLPDESVAAWLAQDTEPGAAAPDELLPLLYAELRSLADGYLAKERAGHTLQATALVHEAWLRLVGPGRRTPRTRAHFIGVAARAMRQVLVDHARRHNSARRSGGRRRVPLDDLPGVLPAGRIDLIALDEALTALADKSPRAARIVEMRFFGGLGVEEVAEVLGVTTRTCERDWRYAQAWLKRALDAEVPRGPDSP